MHQPSRRTRLRSTDAHHVCLLHVCLSHVCARLLLCVLVVIEQNEDESNLDDDGEVANFLVYYEADDTDVYHNLDILYYQNPQTDEEAQEAPDGAWYVVLRE